MSGPSVEKRLPVQHLPAINFALLLYRQRETEQELFPDAEAADQIKGLRVARAGRIRWQCFA